MNISRAVSLRIAELLKKDLSLYGLEHNARLSHDTIKSIIKGKAKESKKTIAKDRTIKNICQPIVTMPFPFKTLVTV